MRLTTRGRFAVTAMVDLAIREEKNPVTLSAISERQKISLSYLEQLFGKLRRSKIVESVRGPGGGYNLAKPAEKITIDEIIVAVDEPLDATRCGGRGDCHGDKTCITHDLWMGLNDRMKEYLREITLQHLIDDHNKSVSGVSEIRLKKVARS